MALHERGNLKVFPIINSDVYSREDSTSNLLCYSLQLTILDVYLRI